MHPIIQDILDTLKSTELQTTVEVEILRPLLARILHILYPYIFGVMVVWIMMFLCLALILLILVRGSLVDILRK
jgi:hypothetical protein